MSENKKSIYLILHRQLRFHQYSKNLLVFIPSLASYNFLNYEVIKNSFIAFLAFSIVASSAYVFNDIVDIDNDRMHPQKKTRPIASGEMSILTAYIILISLVIIGLSLSFYLGYLFLIIILIYISLNILYSLFAKQIIILDLIFLMSFYNIRIIAGHIPNTIPFSPWLISFSIFIFFSLGLLKRYIDIFILKENSLNICSGIYSKEDSNIMLSLGIASGLVSVLVIILYTDSKQVLQFYSTPMILIGLAPLMLYWISRLWLMAIRGRINTDPVLYVLKDKITYIVALIFAFLIIISKYLDF